MTVWASGTRQTEGQFTLWWRDAIFRKTRRTFRAPFTLHDFG
ncbi:Uncharacterised protein [Vibrio cholerae]|nr:Uncharacterised protein [Vibrio cholerae]